MDDLELQVEFLEPVKKLQSLASLCGTNVRAKEDDTILWGMESLLDGIAEEIQNIASRVEKERKELQIWEWAEENRDLIDSLMDDPGFLKKAEALAARYRKAKQETPANRARGFAELPGFPK